jgi:hypothetical protein
MYFMRSEFAAGNEAMRSFNKDGRAAGVKLTHWSLAYK